MIFPEEKIDTDCMKYIDVLEFLHNLSFSPLASGSHSHCLLHEINFYALFHNLKLL